MNDTNDRREFLKCMTWASLGLMLGGLKCSTSQKIKEKEMSEMIAYCGIDCHECGALLATQADDDLKRKQIAEQWSKIYNSDIKPEDINCLGCTTEGNVHFTYCKVCAIRKCAQEKKAINCAHCTSYPCEKLSEFLKMVPEAKQKLDEIRSTLT